MKTAWLWISGGVLTMSLLLTPMATAATQTLTGKCVKHGTRYELVVGKKVYMLKTDHKEKTELSKLTGKDATIKGTLKGKTIIVDAVHTAG